MNVESLKERLTNIEIDLKAQHKQLEQIVANINLLNGSKLECERWIDELCKCVNEEVSEPILTEAKMAVLN